MPNTAFHPTAPAGFARLRRRVNLNVSLSRDMRSILKKYFWDSACPRCGADVDHRRDKEKINDVWHCSQCGLSVVIDDRRTSQRTTIGGAVVVLIAISLSFSVLKLFLVLAVFAASSYKFFSWVQYSGQLGSRITETEESRPGRKNGYRRGEDYVRNVQAEDLQFMQQQFALAKADLRKTLELNPRSYLAILNLMNISMYEDDNESAQALLDAANQLKMDNLLVRARFLVHLQPRWGGSYSQMKRFIDETRSSGAPEDIVDLLSAIQFDDMGFVQEESGDLHGAADSYRRSLALSAKADPRFVHSYLSHAVDWCSQNCQ